LKFEFNWEPGPGVRDQVLRATWAQFSIKIGDQVATEVIDLRSNGRRPHVYGSLFPIAQWLVENWWHLLYEPSPVFPFPGGRSPSLELRPWAQRHCLLAAREGGALPDLVILRDGEEILLSWHPDPTPPSAAKIWFIGNGMCRIPWGQFEEAARYLVGAVLARIQEELSGSCAEVQQLEDAWSAIQAADAVEMNLCRSLAWIGADPYDPDEATDELVGAIQKSIKHLPAELHDGLLAGSTPGSFIDDLKWVQTQNRRLLSDVKVYSFPTIQMAEAATAYDFGYQAARKVRLELLRIPEDEPIEDLPALLETKLGWTGNFLHKSRSGAPLYGIVGVDRTTKAPILVRTQENKRESSRRFLLARAAFFPVTRRLGGGGRIVSQAVTPEQRMSRAFAAELLAPARALKKRIEGRLDPEGVADLAEEFQVSTAVIERQIENHQLGLIAA
jgi:hypothetical protein